MSGLWMLNKSFNTDKSKSILHSVRPGQGQPAASAGGGQLCAWWQGLSVLIHHLKSKQRRLQININPKKHWWWWWWCPPLPNYKFQKVPAMFPRAHTACSQMCWWGDDTRLTKARMAPPSTTAAVWAAVPEAMLVRAQEASNWMGGQSARPRKVTNWGISPALIIWSMGGFLSRDSSFLQVSTHGENEWVMVSSNWPLCPETCVFVYNYLIFLLFLPCSLCGLELHLKITTVYSCENLIDGPLSSDLAEEGNKGGGKSGGLKLNEKKQLSNQSNTRLDPFISIIKSVHNRLRQTSWRSEVDRQREKYI